MVFILIIRQPPQKFIIVIMYCQEKFFLMKNKPVTRQTLSGILLVRRPSPAKPDKQEKTLFPTKGKS